MLQPHSAKKDVVEKQVIATRSIDNPCRNPSPPTTDLEEQVTSSPNPTCAEEQTLAFKSLGLLNKLLPIWILLAMILGILLGNFVPDTGRVLQQGNFVGVSIPIAVGLLVMMYPILCNVRYEALHVIFRQKALWKQLVFSLFVNWIVGPFLMLALAWAFLPDEMGLRVGLVLVGLGRCIAMVLVWNGLAGGDAEYCAILVAVNSVLQMLLFAPLAIFFINIIGHSRDAVALSYTTVATGVGVFLGIPFGAAALTRLILVHIMGRSWYDAVFVPRVAPLSLIGLLYTIAVLFAAQGQQVVKQIVSVVRVAAPMVVYFFTIFASTVAVARRFGMEYRLACTQGFTAASNNFELAIAVATATFGPESDQALAATVGPLVEVPVLLGLVYLMKWVGKRWTKEK